MTDKAPECDLYKAIRENRAARAEYEGIENTLGNFIGFSAAVTGIWIAIGLVTFINLQEVSAIQYEYMIKNYGCATHGIFQQVLQDGTVTVTEFMSLPTLEEAEAKAKLFNQTLICSEDQLFDLQVLEEEKLHE
ncbi:MULTISPECIES: hypothetical protein [Vibrio]|uniref:hypothetical protein n=1 Tax=Vibrio TaxID=662 RepID=UPI00078B650B|nr:MULTISPECIES: hypothetical protein [Vibrio]BAU70963.1 hypothetical protein [Vibrio sp. 04Ya108]BBM67779.1 hypothetical protein VA249_44250 [Vibrio alfacsensis]BCN26950.1 hypothetical protein VYA_41420 [Vibrio alfacsensis]